jgi:hypothetical protein
MTGWRRRCSGASRNAEAAVPGSITRRLPGSESNVNPALAGRLDPTHAEIDEKLEADIAHRRAVAGMQEA